MFDPWSLKGNTSRLSYTDSVAQDQPAYPRSLTWQLQCPPISQCTTIIQISGQFVFISGQIARTHIWPDLDLIWSYTVRIWHFTWRLNGKDWERVMLTPYWIIRASFLVVTSTSIFGILDIKKCSEFLISKNDFLISRIRFFDIKKWFFDIKKWFFDIKKSKSWYQEMTCISWYQKFDFLISKNRILDIKK